MKETDLQLLNTIKAEQYIKFEEVRQNHFAKQIQRSWRKFTDRKELAADSEPNSADDGKRAFQRTTFHAANKYAKFHSKANQLRKKKNNELSASMEKEKSQHESEDETGTAAEIKLKKRMKALRLQITELYQKKVQQDLLHPFQPASVPGMCYFVAAVRIGLS